MPDGQIAKADSGWRSRAIAVTADDDFVPDEMPSIAEVARELDAQKAEATELVLPAVHIEHTTLDPAYGLYAVLLIMSLLAWDTARRWIAARHAERVETKRLDTYEAALKNGLEQLTREVSSVRSRVSGAELGTMAGGRRAR